MPDSVVPRALVQADRRSRWSGYEQPSLFEAMPPKVKVGDIVDIPKGADPICTIHYRIEVASLNWYGVSGPRIKADGSRMVSRSSISADENGFYVGVASWDVVARSTIIPAETAA